MLTYKIISKNGNKYIYKYFPQGKDVKVSGGIIEIDIKDKTFIIESVAQLDERGDITDEDIEEIVSHINKLRNEENFPLLTIEEFNKNNTKYKYASSLINEVYAQIDKNSIKDKGIVFL